MDEAAVLATTYLDSCVIERYGDHENPITHITEQIYAPVHDGVLICGFSQSNSGDLPVIGNGNVVNVTTVEHKLFMMPNSDVMKGDRITVTQSTGHKHVLYAKKPMFYPSHTEIELTGSEIDAKK
ncbi:hypothetical protein G8C15_07970 [Enterococcus casseliflavus]|nr:hypothetical protein [Enterococcus casseliflavus]